MQVGRRPTACQHTSRGQRPGSALGSDRRQQLISRPIGAGAIPVRSIPHITLVILDLISCQEDPKLLLKRLNSMMVLLVFDVAPHSFDVGLADGKRTVTVLPMNSLRRQSCSLSHFEDPRLVSITTSAKARVRWRLNSTCTWSHTELMTSAGESSSRKIPAR